MVENTMALRKRLVREIRRFKPEVIVSLDPTLMFTPMGGINHPDHRNAGLVALEALFPAADNPMFYPDMANEGYLPHKISQLYVTGYDDPSVEVDVTDDVDTKIQAILSHKSQFDKPEEIEKWMRERWGDEQEDGTRRYFERFKAMRFDRRGDEEEEGE